MRVYICITSVDKKKIPLKRWNMIIRYHEIKVKLTIRDYNRMCLIFLNSIFLLFVLHFDNKQNIVFINLVWFTDYVHVFPLRDPVLIRKMIGFISCQIDITVLMLHSILLGGVFSFKLCYTGKRRVLYRKLKIGTKFIKLSHMMLVHQ